jgi:hypothetical protein
MAIKLELEVQEVNLVLRSLGKHPFDEIASLIGKIKQQGEAQLAEQEKANADAASAAEAPAAE